MRRDAPNDWAPESFSFKKKVNPSNILVDQISPFPLNFP